MEPIIVDKDPTVFIVYTWERPMPSQVYHYDVMFTFVRVNQLSQTT